LKIDFGDFMIVFVVDTKLNYFNVVKT